MATDLAEFLGAALGFNLLFGIPLWLAGVLTAIATFLILGLERRGSRPLEAVITALVGIVAVVPLIMFTQRRDVMGLLVNRRITTFLASMFAVIIIALNAYLLYQTFLAGS